MTGIGKVNRTGNACDTLNQNKRQLHYRKQMSPFTVKENTGFSSIFDEFAKNLKGWSSTNLVIKKKVLKSSFKCWISLAISVVSYFFPIIYSPLFAHHLWGAECFPSPYAAKQVCWVIVYRWNNCWFVDSECISGSIKMRGGSKHKAGRWADVEVFGFVFGVFLSQKGLAKMCVMFRY